MQKVEIIALSELDPTSFGGNEVIIDLHHLLASHCNCADNTKDREGRSQNYPCRSGYLYCHCKVYKMDIYNEDDMCLYFIRCSLGDICYLLHMRFQL